MLDFEIEEAILEEVKDYYEHEYGEVMTCLKNEYNIFDVLISALGKKKIVDNSWQRIFGVAQFSQQLGVSFEKIDKLYDEYRAKYMTLLSTIED